MGCPRRFHAPWTTLVVSLCLPAIAAGQDGAAGDSSAAPVIASGAAAQGRTASAVAELRGKCQMRLFTINRGKLDDFVKAWLKGVYPLRLKHGFTIPAAWAVPETNQFMWALCYEGPEEWDAKEAAYYGSEERGALDPDPRQLIARVERWFITPVVPAPRAKPEGGPLTAP